MKTTGILLMAIFVFAGFLFAQVDLDKGLVGYYKMDEGEGTTTANSAVLDNKAPDGELIGPPEWVEGYSGKGLRFTEGDGKPYVALGTHDPSEGTDELSVSVWINWDGIGTGWHGICGKRDGWDDNSVMWSMVLDQTSGGIQFETFTNGGKVYLITPDAPPVNEWLHVVLTMDGIQEYATFYFNGETVAEGTMQFGTNRETTFHFGCGVMDGGAAFSGILDELRFYERLLTDEEILALYNYDPSSAVEHGKNTVAHHFSLHQNYPNPFNPATKISYSLYGANHVTLRVYDILGKEVGTLVDEFQTPNTYTVDFHAGDLPGGVYYYKLSVDQQFMETKKMLLMK